MVCVQCNISSLDFGYIVSAAITAVCGMSFSVDRCTRITRSVSFAIVRALQPARSLPNFVIHGHVLSVMSRKVSDVSIFIHHILNFRGI